MASCRISGPIGTTLNSVRPWPKIRCCIKFHPTVLKIAAGRLKIRKEGTDTQIDRQV